MQRQKVTRGYDVITKKKKRTRRSSIGKNILKLKMKGIKTRNVFRFTYVGHTTHAKKKKKRVGNLLVVRFVPTNGRDTATRARTGPLFL